MLLAKTHINFIAANWILENNQNEPFWIYQLISTANLEMSRLADFFSNFLVRFILDSVTYFLVNRWSVLLNTNFPVFVSNGQPRISALHIDTVHESNQIYLVMFMCLTVDTSFMFSKKIKCCKCFFDIGNAEMAQWRQKSWNLEFKVKKSLNISKKNH